MGLGGAGLAGAANDYFLQIEGIKGSSTDAYHKDWIDIDGFGWGLTQTGSVAGGGGGAGKASFADLSWTQAVDLSTPKWMLSVATGKHIPKVTLDVVRTGGKGGNDSFFQMIFTDTQGTGLHVTGTGANLLASAQMSSGTTVKLRFRPQDDKGGFGAWVEGSFNIRTNEAKALFTGDDSVLLGLFSAGGAIAFDAGAVNPVPEPAQAVLFGGGLLALLAFSRRRGA